MTVRNIIKKATAASATALALATLVSGRLYALDLNGGMTAAGGSGQASGKLESEIPKIIGVAMWAIGIISVIILIVAGIMYATAAGDESKVKKAKHAIIGAIVGLVIAILASAIVNFVVGAL